MKREEAVQEFRLRWRMVISKYLRLLSLVAVYLVFAQIFGYHLQWINPLDEKWEILLPIFLSFLAAFLGMPNAIRCLQISSRSDQAPFLYQIFAGLSLIAQILLGLHWLQFANAKEAKVQSSEEVQMAKDATHFAWEKPDLDSNRISFEMVASLGGDRNEKEVFNLFLVAPTISESSDPFPQVFIGKRYSIEIRSDEPEEVKKATYMAFVTASFDEFGQLGNELQPGWERVKRPKELATYNKALQRYDSTFNWSQSILIVPTTNTLAQSHNKAKWLFIILALVINLLFLVAIRVPKLNQEVIKAQLEGQNTALQATLAELKAIVPGRENWLSSSMAALNVLVFLGVVILSGSLIAIPAEILLKFGGNLRQNVLSGEYWRLLSNTFLHGGLQHIVYNMFGLLVTGSLIELKLGKLRFLAIYFVSGLAASICSLVWHENTISIGASGAIMGLVGGLACLAAMRVLAPSEHASLLKLSLFYIVGAVFGLLDSGTDNAAHFGGLAAGFLVTLTIVLVVGREKLKSQMATLE